jgi:hypothetical protein
LVDICSTLGREEKWKPASDVKLKRFPN